MFHLVNDDTKPDLTSPSKSNIDIVSDASNIKVNLPATFCAGREERVRVTAGGDKVNSKIKAELIKKGHSKSKAVAITHDEKDGSYLLLVKPQEEGEYSLSVTVHSQHIPKSPFLLPVNNRDYYQTNFKQPLQTIDICDPRHIAFSSNGDMFVTSGFTHSIHVYDTHGQKKKEIGKQGEGNLEFRCPYGIAINGNVMYVADGNNHRVQKLSTDGMFLSKFGSRESGDGQLYFPTGLTISPNGVVYVSNHCNRQVVVFSETDAFIRKIDVSASVKGPWGLALSANCNLHIAGYLSHNYAVLSSTGKLVRSHEFVKSTDVVIDAAGFVFAVHSVNDSSSLSIFDAQGHVIHTIKLDRPWGVGRAPDGFIWVAGHLSGKLWKF